MLTVESLRKAAARLGASEKAIAISADKKIVMLPADLVERVVVEGDAQRWQLQMMDRTQVKLVALLTEVAKAGLGAGVNAGDGDIDLLDRVRLAVCMLHPEPTFTGEIPS